MEYSNVLSLKTIQVWLEVEGGQISQPKILKEYCLDFYDYTYQLSSTYYAKNTCWYPRLY